MPRRRGGGQNRRRVGVGDGCDRHRDLQRRKHTHAQRGVRSLCSAPNQTDLRSRLLRMRACRSLSQLPRFPRPRPNAVSGSCSASALAALPTLGAGWAHPLDVCYPLAGAGPLGGSHFSASSGWLFAGDDHPRVRTEAPDASMARAVGSPVAYISHINTRLQPLQRNGIRSGLSMIVPVEACRGGIRGERGGMPGGACELIPPAKLADELRERRQKESSGGLGGSETGRTPRSEYVSIRRLQGGWKTTQSAIGKRPQIIPPFPPFPPACLPPAKTSGGSVRIDPPAVSPVPPEPRYRLLSRVRERAHVHTFTRDRH